VNKRTHPTLSFFDDRSKEYKKVPIATINEKPYFGSDEIIQEVLAVTRNPRGRSTHFDDDSARRWQAFCESDLAPLLYPNMCSTLNDSYRAFSYVEDQPQWSALQKLSIRSVGSIAMYMAASRVKSK
jgi:hypothetical protein